MEHQVNSVMGCDDNIELRLKLDKSVPRLDASAAERPCSLKTLLQASLMASTMAPLHPRRLAWRLAVSCQSIAQAFDLTGAEANRRWDKIAEILTHSGKDPNGRHQPSVLDQLRGWKRRPASRQKARPNTANVAYVDKHASPQ